MLSYLQKGYHIERAGDDSGDSYHPELLEAARITVQRGLVEALNKKAFLEDILNGNYGSGRMKDVVLKHVNKVDAFAKGQYRKGTKKQ